MQHPTSTYLEYPYYMGRGKCRVDGCKKWAVKGGVCWKHGAKVNAKLCSYEGGCPNLAVSGGVCIRHGAKRKPLCNHPGGCTNQVVKEGVCKRHGAKVKLCSIEECTNQARRGGVCIRHGAKVKRCSEEGCTNKAVKGGVCVKHGATYKLCSSEGCTKRVFMEGKCWKHGANKRTTLEAIKESEETSPHMIEQDGGEVPPSVDQHTSTRAKKRRRVSSAATSSTDTEEEEMAANADEQVGETQRTPSRSSKRLSKKVRLNYNYDDDDDEEEEEEEEEGGDNEDEGEDTGGDEDWGVEEQVDHQLHMEEEEEGELVVEEGEENMDDDEEEEEEDDDDDEEEGGDNKTEGKDRGGDEDWEAEGEVEEGEETQSHFIEDVEGKEPSREELLEQIKSLKEKNESLTKKNESLNEKNESLKRENSTLKKENSTLKRQLRPHMVDLTETEQSAQGGEGIGSLATLQRTIKVKKEYKKRVEEKDEKLKELTAALERLREPKRKTGGRGGNTVNPEKEKEELIRNLSTHNVRLAQSKIKGAGIGVFAMTTIRKGTKLFQINGEELSGETISLKETEIANELPEHVQTVVKAFLLPDDKGCRDVPKNGLSLALGVSFYLNTAKGTGKKHHNVEFSEELDAFGFNTMITTRRIEKDEELLLSYDVNDTK